MEATISDLKSDLARKAIGAPLHPSVTPELSDDHLDNSCSESLAGWRVCGRTTGLVPEQSQESIRPLRPFQINLPVQNRQGAILGGIGSKFVQSYGHSLGSVRF